MTAVSFEGDNVDMAKREFMKRTLPSKVKGYFGSASVASTTPIVGPKESITHVLDREAAMELYFALQAAIGEWSTLNFNDAAVKKLRMTLSIKSNKRVTVHVR